MSLRISKAMHTVTMTLGALVIGATLVPNAIAGCGQVSAQPGNSKPAFFQPAAYRVISEFSQSGQNGDAAPAGADIVGMWKFTFVSKNSAGIPDDTPID